MSQAIREEQAQRWLAGDKVSLEALVEAHPELAADAAAMVDLICGEIALRCAAGQTPQLGEYLARFPQCAAVLCPVPTGQGQESPRPASDPAHALEPGTQLGIPADLPSVVLDPSALARAAADPPAGPRLAPALEGGSSPVRVETASAAAAATDRSAEPSPGPPPPVAAAHLSALLRDLPAGGGTMMVAVPPAAIPPPAAPPPSYDTVQSLGDPKDVTAIIQRIQAPTLKIPGYDIQKELGRGGMGVVYRARQLSADRIVALKVIRNDVLETLPHETRSSTIERFRHEAQAAAKIEHDHLVSIYEVGEAEGLKYYAMRFVEGKSLADMLRDGPLPNQRAAGYLEPVCRAIHAIHEHGVLHRDIKPHNIMIDRRGDRPLVTDFGLAKFVGGQDELTHAGSVMGTPSYMSPEQAKDSGKVTALADVYSLGATLYHCLTGRAPFQAAHVADTLRQILNDDPLPPRRLNSAIDRDLETICLKSLQKDPAQRYASAQALADDLARYLRHEPILARPIGLFGRTWRWCRRNRMVASLIATAAMLAIVALVAIGVGYYKTSLALEESNLSLRRALAVVDEFCTVVAEDDLMNRPGFQPLRRDLLERAQRYYEAFLAQRENDPYLRDELGQAYYRLGVIHRELDNREAALEALQKALRVQRQQVALAEPDVGRRKSLGDTLNALGSLLQKLNRMGEADEALREAAEVRTALAVEFPESAEFQRVAANTLMNQGILELNRATGERDAAPLVAARQFIEAAQARRRECLPHAGAAKRSILRDLARGYYSLTQVGLMQHELLGSAGAVVPFAEIDREFDEANQLFRQLIEERPELMDRYYLALSLRMQGDARLDRKELDLALASYRDARQELEVLARENPEVASYQLELIELQFSLADVHRLKDEVADARGELLSAREKLTEFKAKWPDDPQLEARFAEVEQLLADLNALP